MPGGVPGTDASGTGPFARALRQLLQEGKPFTSISHCYFKDESGVPRWFGVFVHSAGDRVIFFPGVAEPVDGIQTDNSGTKTRHVPFDFDHLSLERDRRTWHATSVGSRAHLAGPPTLPLGEGRVLWFGMSVASPHALRTVNAKTEVSALVHPNDGKRRAAVLSKARESSTFPMMSLNTDWPAAPSPAFLHFAVVVGPAGFPEYRGPEFGLPFDSPFVVDGLASLPAELPVRMTRFALSETVDVQITCTALVGTLSVPASFASPLPT